MSLSVFESYSKGVMLFCFAVEGQDDAWVEKRLCAPEGKNLVCVDQPSQSTSLFPFLISFPIFPSPHLLPLSPACVCTPQKHDLVSTYS